MSRHEALVDQIKNVLAINKKSKDIVKSEFLYRIGSKEVEYAVDIIFQRGGIIHIFECKVKSQMKKARKQLEFHKKAIENNPLDFYWIGVIQPYSKIKTYYISEEENTIINLESGEEEVLDPSFIQDPLSFLNR